MGLYIGTTTPPPLVALTTRASTTTISTASLSTIVNVNAGDFLVFGSNTPNA